MGQAAQKISKVDHDELLRLLNVAYAEEWLAYYQYWIGAQVAVGPMRTTIVKEFLEHAGEELQHAQWLSDRIIQLGGTPVLNPNEFESIALCRYDAPTQPYVMNLLQQNLTAERCAVGRYQQICDMCFGKDHDTYRMAAKILKEELEHEQEIGDFEEDIRLGVELGANMQSA